MDELLRRFKNPVYRFAFRLSSNTAEAHDITQEVFLLIHTHRHSYKPAAQLSTWILRIAHNVFVSRWRKNRRLVLWPRKQGSGDEFVDMQSPDPSPREVVIQDELSEMVKQCVQALPLLQREALVLREFENYDYGEIAVILNKSLGTVKTLIHRARMSVRDKLLPLLKEEGGL